VIWEPFILALVLGIIVSAGLYFAYLWPSVEPDDDALAAPAASPEPPTDARGTDTDTDAASAAP
jgi:hypothetical protein